VDSSASSVSWGRARRSRCWEQRPSTPGACRTEEPAVAPAQDQQLLPRALDNR
jgi:hypothetical protein